MNELTFSEKTRSAIGAFYDYLNELCLEESELNRLVELFTYACSSFTDDAFDCGVSEGVKAGIKATREALGIEKAAP